MAVYISNPRMWTAKAKRLPEFDIYVFLWPHYVDQASLELKRFTCLCLPCVGIKGIYLIFPPKSR